MWYAFIAEDNPGSLSKRLEVRPRHLARLEALRDAGRLLLAGPCPAVDSETPGEAGFTGSIIIAEFPSLADAEAWARLEPYVEAGVHARVTVKPFKKTLP
jgi:uncharacterized protein YciI